MIAQGQILDTVDNGQANYPSDCNSFVLVQVTLGDRYVESKRWKGHRLV